MLKEWLAKHPGGQYLSYPELEVWRSKTKRVEYVPITRDEASDHFKRTLAGSKWEKRVNFTNQEFADFRALIAAQRLQFTLSQ